MNEQKPTALEYVQRLKGTGKGSFIAWSMRREGYKLNEVFDACCGCGYVCSIRNTKRGRKLFVSDDPVGDKLDGLSQMDHIHDMLKQDPDKLEWTEWIEKPSLLEKIKHFMGW